MDRSSQEDLIAYAEKCWEEDENDPRAVIAVMEASRLGSLPQELLSFIEDKLKHFSGDPTLSEYLQGSGRARRDSHQTPAKILVITNIFPPQELGGFGKQLWEFSSELMKDGHKLKILSSDVPELFSEKSEQYCYFENKVDRSLKNYGDWTKMPPDFIANSDEVVRSAAFNYNRIIEVLDEFNPDYCLVGNMEKIGIYVVRYILSKRIPVLNICGNRDPGYPPEETPPDPLYRLAPCSNWLNEKLQIEGYGLFQPKTMYPGSLLEDFYHYFQPQYDKLRIACACLLISRKGVHVLLDALGILKKNKVDFVCEIAGSPAELNYKKQLDELVRQHDLEKEIRFIGFQGNDGLRELFGRSNVFVFPTIDNEPFGKSSIEAMAAGLLLISSGTGGQSEIFKDGVSGIQYSAHNAEELAATMSSLVEDTDVWKRIALAGQSRAFDFHSSLASPSVMKAFGEIQNSSHEQSDISEHMNNRQELMKATESSFVEALNYFHNGDAHGALNCIKSVPKNKAIAELQLAHGLIYFLLEDWNNSAPHLLNSIVMKPDEWSSYAALALIYYKMNGLDQALEFLEIASGFTADNKPLSHIIAKIYKEKGVSQRSDEIKNEAFEDARQSEDSLSPYASIVIAEIQKLI